MFKLTGPAFGAFPLKRAMKDYVVPRLGLFWRNFHFTFVLASSDFQSTHGIIEIGLYFPPHLFSHSSLLESMLLTSRGQEMLAITHRIIEIGSYFPPHLSLPLFIVGVYATNITGKNLLPTSVNVKLT